MNKDERKTSLKNILLTLFERFVCMRGSWRLNKDCNILTSPAPPDIPVCRSRSGLLINRRAGGPASQGRSHPSIFSPTGLVSNFNRGSRGPLLLGGGFPYHILSLTHLISNSSDLQLTDFLSLPSYIIVQSPTQSLEWHVWSSSSGNNCHAVQRSLSFSAKVYECIMGFYLVPFRQPNPPTRFLSITGHWNVSLPSGASLWNGMFDRVEGQYTTVRPLNKWCMSKCARRPTHNLKTKAAMRVKQIYSEHIIHKPALCRSE